MNTNMRAMPLLKERIVLGERAFAEIVIWRLASPLAGSSHRFKYRMALIVDGVCAMRFDNEAGKGDHKHVGRRQVSYAFTNYEQLIDDFWSEVERWTKNRVW